MNRNHVKINVACPKISMWKKNHMKIKSHILCTTCQQMDLVRKSCERKLSMYKKKSHRQIHDWGEKNHINGLRINDYSIIWMMWWNVIMCGKNHM